MHFGSQKNSQEETICSRLVRQIDQLTTNKTNGAGFFSSGREVSLVQSFTDRVEGKFGESSEKARIDFRSGVERFGICERHTGLRPTNRLSASRHTLAEAMLRGLFKPIPLIGSRGTHQVSSYDPTFEPGGAYACDCVTSRRSKWNFLLRTNNVKRTFFILPRENWMVALEPLRTDEIHLLSLRAICQRNEIKND